MNRKRLRSGPIVAALLALATTTAWSAPPALRCVIEPDRVAEVGSPVIGVIESIQVERGDVVKEGQILARLRANVERASVGAAEVRAEADADVRAAQANFDYLREKQQRSEELVEKNFISRQALDQVRAEASVAEQKLAQSREQQRIAKHELALAKAQLGLRLIRAPFDGIIADRYVTVGERVEEKPIFRVARIDPLRVEIIVPAALYGSVRAGMVAKVTPDLPNVAPMDTKVVLVDKLVDAASNTFRVRSELPNADGAIASGLRCRAEFTAGEPLARADVPKQVSGGRLSTDLQTVPAQASKKN
ncbi:MAG: efflux RND transporter periplasmic adaptor subunit [Betaproteobacteria bacterium]